MGRSPQKADQLLQPAAQTRPKKTAKPHPNTETDADWEAIRRDYETGAYSVRQIAARHGIAAHSTVYNRAKKENWASNSTGRVKARRSAQELTQAAAEALAKGLIAETPRDQEAAIDAAAAVQVEVVRQHKSLIGRLNKQADRLLTTIEGENINRATSRKAAKDLLENLSKLSMIAGRLIPMEREAHGLDLDDKGAAHDTLPLKDRLQAYRKAGEWQGQNNSQEQGGEQTPATGPKLLTLQGKTGKQ